MKHQPASSRLVLFARTISPRTLTAACITTLLLLNIYICRNLFHTEFIQETESVDLAFMSFSRWLIDHWNDRSWLPMWVSGLPVRQVYNPLLHHAVAFLGRTFDWSAPHAYHFLTATTYCLGPVTLFWLAYYGTGRHGFAMLTATLYSLISPSAFLVTAVRIDNGSLFYPRRFQTLVHYGEGPHVTALMWIPLVIWILHQACVRRRWQFLPLAPISLAALVLTNWTGTTGFAMALAAFVASKFGTRKIGERSLHWPTLIAVGILAYALASPWIPPSLIRTVQTSSVNLDIVTPAKIKYSILGALALILIALHFLFQRRAVPSIYRFFIYFTLITGTVSLSRMWYGLALVPIGHRFQLELEMGLVAVVAMLALAIGQRLPKPLQIAALVLLLIGGASQARLYRREARNTTKPFPAEAAPQYPMSQWFAQNMAGRRVLAPGTISIWMNLFSDVPQFIGCCDQSVRTDTYRDALYQIYSGEGAAGREGEVAAMWLKVYGISAIGVYDSPASQQPFLNPKKFDGVLPELWRIPGNVVYQVPRPNDSLAHVVPGSALLAKPPINGVDTDPLLPLINALDHPASLASFQWINQHEAEINATTSPGDVIYVQQTCDPGWHILDSAAALRCDAIGLMVIDPGPGTHTLRLAYTSSPEDKAVNAAQLAAVAILIVWTLRARRRALAGHGSEKDS